MLIRGPTPRHFGTACCQVRWQEPPITRRSPGLGSHPPLAPPPAGRSRNGRIAPSETSATTASGSSRPTRSPCHAPRWVPARQRLARGCVGVAGGRGGGGGGGGGGVGGGGSSGQR